MGLKLDKSIEWDSKLTIAAHLLAEGQLSHAEIATLVGRSASTLAGWLSHPEFKARVEAVRVDLCQAVAVEARKLSIKEKTHRLERMEEDWSKLLTVRDARAKSKRWEEDEIPGIETGLIVVKETAGTTKDGGSWRKIEAGIDTGYLTAVQNLETQAARELGQLDDPSVNINVKLYGGFNPEDV
jgi:hypothetical protein